MGAHPVHHIPVLYSPYQVFLYLGSRCPPPTAMQDWYLPCFRMDYGHVQKLVDFLESSMQRLLSFRRDPSLTPLVFHKLMTSCSPRERNLKESCLEISQTICHWSITPYIHLFGNALFMYLRAFRWKWTRAPSCWNHIRRRIPSGTSSSILGNSSLRNT